MWCLLEQDRHGQLRPSLLREYIQKKTASPLDAVQTVPVEPCKLAANKATDTEMKQAEDAQVDEIITSAEPDDGSCVSEIVSRVSAGN